MRRRIIYEPNYSEVALLILKGLKGAFIESFWPHPYYHTFCEHADERSFRNSIYRLQKRRLIIAKKQRNGKIAFNLSEKGMKIADNISKKLELSKKRHWDGKWRILLFDIPEKMRSKRDFFRRELKEFGFYQLQKSVWVYPHDLPDDFFDLWEDFDFRDQVRVVEQARIKYDTDLRNYYGF